MSCRGRLALLSIGVAMVACNGILGLDERGARAAAGGDGGSAAMGGGGQGGSGASGGGGTGGDNPPPTWAHAFGAEAFDSVLSLAVDASCGDVFAGGLISGDVDVLSNPVTSTGGVDGLILGLDGIDGSVSWLAHITDASGGAGDQAVTALGLAGSDLYAGLIGVGTFDVLGLGGIDATGVDSAIVRLDTRGTATALFSIGGSGNAFVRDVAVDQGRVVAFGEYGGQLIIDGFVRTAITDSDLWVVELDAELGMSTASAFDGSGTDAAHAVVIGGSGLFVGAETGSAGAEDGVVDAIPDVGGGWRATLAGAGMDSVYDIAVGADDAVLIAGALSGSAEIAGNTLTSMGTTDAVLVSLDPSGSFQWARTFGVNGTTIFVAMDVAVDGSIVLTGTTTGTVNFGGDDLVSLDGRDLFVARLTATGDHLASVIFTGTSTQLGNAVRDCGDGTVIVAGQFLDNLTIGDAMFTASGPAPDAFIARLQLSPRP